MTTEKRQPPSKQRSVALARIEANEKKWVQGFAFGAVIARSIATVFIVYFISTGLTSIVLSQPENIDALSRFVGKIRLGEAMGYLVAGVMGVAYTRERRGKKRLIEEKGKLQRELEASDPSRSSSGLDMNGVAPGEED